MASSFSTRLRLEKMADGEKASTWGQVMDVVLDMLDDSIAGMVSIATTGGTTTLSANNNATDQARMAILKVTGALVSNATLSIPSQSKKYVVWNATSGAFTVSLQSGAGTAAVIAQGKKATVICDGSDCYHANTDYVGMGLGTAAVADTGTGAGNVVTLDVSSKLPAVDGSQLTNLASSGASTGDFQPTIKTTASAGFVMCDDGTIGDASSGASNRANADTSALYTLLWNNVSDTYAPVTGGRGASAAADFAAHKKIALLKMLGRAIGAAGTGATLTARSLGQTLGEETHTMTTAEMVTHAHGVSDPTHTHVPLMGGNPAGYDSAFTTTGFAVGNSGASTVYGSGSTTASATGIGIQNNGSSTPFNVMQPTTFINWMIKL